MQWNINLKTILELIILYIKKTLNNTLKKSEKIQTNGVYHFLKRYRMALLIHVYDNLHFCYNFDFLTLCIWVQILKYRM